MQTSTRTVLRIGDWRVDPVSGEMARNGEAPVRVEARTMRLLQCLAEHAGETVSIDDLLSQAWPDVTVTSDSVYQSVATLRRLLGDDPKNPVYIATVPRLGYRMLAPVSAWMDEIHDAAAGQRRRPRAFLLWGGCALMAVLLAGAFLVYSRMASRREAATGSAAQRSVAVLPFLDLTEGMRNEEFADGVTEELIDKLSKVPGLHVSSATASFYFKNKQVALGEIAKKLGVAYILDGSVRKSGARLRVAARLVRAETGYVMWTETYDRPAGDLIMVQDDIAGDVTSALTQSIKGQR
jgi:transcriptional activator of cad operon